MSGAHKLSGFTRVFKNGALYPIFISRQMGFEQIARWAQEQSIFIDSSLGGSQLE